MDSRLSAGRDAFRAAVLRSMNSLVEADAGAAAGLVLAHCADDHAAVVASLDPMPELQYEYLKVRLLDRSGDDTPSTDIQEPIQLPWLSPPVRPAGCVVCSRGTIAHRSPLLAVACESRPQL